MTTPPASRRPAAPEGGGRAQALRSHGRAAGTVAGLTLASRVLGFARWVVQATCVGAGTVAGAYSTANQVPNVLYEVVVGGALAATVVPLLASAVGAGRQEEVSRTASALLGVVLAVLAPLGLALALLADPVAGLLPTSQGVDPGLQRDLVASFLRMFALQVPLYGLGVVLTGVLQAHGRFTWPALTPIASSLVVMAAYAAYARMTAPTGTAPSSAALAVLGWGTTAGVAALSLPLAWPVARLGVRLRPSLRLDRPTAVRVLRLGGAGLTALVAQQASVVTVLALARAGGTTGTVAVYQYTQAVYVLPYAVLAVPVATVVYPRLSAAFDREARQAREAHDPTAGPTQGAGDQSPAWALAARSTAVVGAVAVAGSAMLLAAGHGAERFFALLTDVEGMGASLAVLAPGLVGYALVLQATRSLLAADRARAAAWASAAGWAAVIPASWLAVRLMAPDGGQGPATLVALAAGQTTGMVVGGAAVLAALARAGGPGVLAPTCRVLALSVPVAAVAGAAVRWLSTQVPADGAAIVLGALGALAAAAAVLAAARLADPTVVGALRRPGGRPGPNGPRRTRAGTEAGADPRNEAEPRARTQEEST
ncbi:murein biosynthesis integral membrane protein MurJ [Actinomyces howellii]|uniref:Integral membrane protein MviN n=1 Tax=Actinomyces howellii TaxID=52771 RepID=A0A3S4V3P5_9ACTO|nr:lipid II flippase MurJ [Actinomyces howellii]VEG26677.1 integral membrane protein MviN [Actinomyces howellii]